MQQEPAGTNWGFIGKCVGGMFATIIAPLLVAMVSQRMASPPVIIAPPAAPAVAPAPAVATPATISTAAPVPKPVAPVAAPAPVVTSAAPAVTTPASSDGPAHRLQRKAAPDSEPTKLASNTPSRTEPPKSASTPAASTPARKRTLDQAFPKAKFVSIFDGKTLSGWNADGPKHWLVVAGAITGKLGPNAADPRDFLYTTTNYRNFVLTARFKCSSGDAGILFRGKPNSLIALQVFIGKVKPGALGTMTDDSPRNHDQKFQTIVDNAAAEKLINHDAWNSITIAANSDRIRCDINDQPAFDTQYADGLHAGVISFKLKPGTEVAFKDIRIARLGAE